MGRANRDTQAGGAWRHGPPHRGRASHDADVLEQPKLRAALELDLIEIERHASRGAPRTARRGLEMRRHQRVVEVGRGQLPLDVRA